MAERDPRIEDHYEDLAAHWDDIVDAPSRQELLWATVDDLLPDVTRRNGAVTNRGTYYRRSFEGLLSPLLTAGFDLEAVREPVPDEQFRRDYPELAADLVDLLAPSLCLRASR